MTERKLRYQRQGGFSLLEILVALMVLTIGLSAVFLLFGQGISTQAKSVNHMEASRLAQSVFAQISQNVQKTGSLPAQKKNETHPSFSDRYRYDVKFKQLKNTDNAVAVKIIVHWEHRGERQEEVFHSVIRPK